MPYRVNPVLLMPFTAENVLHDMRGIPLPVIDSHLVKINPVTLAIIPGAHHMTVTRMI
jgi:hypothetical protein